LPGACNERERVIRELRDRVQVLRRVHDYLLPLECRVEVGDDAYLPGALGGQPERLRRCAVLATRAERALVELGGIGSGLELGKGAGPPAATGGHDDEAA
jgi:hypothetical protein